MESYDEAEIKMRLIALLTHLFDQNKMDDEQMEKWVKIIKDADTH